jgi:hypothetical protein
MQAGPFQGQNSEGTKKVRWYKVEAKGVQGCPAGLGLYARAISAGDLRRHALCLLAPPWTLG